MGPVFQERYHTGYTPDRAGLERVHAMVASQRNRGGATLRRCRPTQARRWHCVPLTGGTRYPSAAPSGRVGVLRRAVSATFPLQGPAVRMAADRHPPTASGGQWVQLQSVFFPL